MCGIVGVFGKGGDKQTALKWMLQAVRPRGETDEVLLNDEYCVGTRRLKIVDRERAVQPIFNEAKDKFIILNGEIFNYKELKRDLEVTHEFTTNSDTETILHAYEEYGEQCLHKLDGQFAFVIYDIAKPSIFAARDHVGIVPLYFVLDTDAIYIASTVTALTFLNRKISAVPPGHIVDIRGHLKAYYCPQYHRTALTQTQFVRNLRQALQDAVAKRVDTDLPVGVIFSGGVDSSIVLNEAIQRHNQVTAFTIGTRRSKDIKISRKFCRERNIRHVVVTLEHKDIGPASIRHAIKVTELNEYLDIINAVISLPLFQRIHKEGIKVVLGGATEATSCLAATICTGISPQRTSGGFCCTS